MNTQQGGGGVQRSLGEHEGRLDGHDRELDEVRRQLEQERTDRREEMERTRKQLLEAMNAAVAARQAWGKGLLGKLKLSARVAFATALFTAAWIGLWYLHDPRGLKVFFTWLLGL